MKNLITAVAVSALMGGLLATTPAAARTAESKAMVNEAKHQYEADRKACRSMSGNDKDVCVKEAKAKRKAAMADADVKNRNTRGNREDAVEARRKGNYEVDKEKCDALSGAAKSACEHRAEARRDDMKAKEKAVR